MALRLIIQRRLPLTQRVAGLDRNRWPVWIGMGGRFASEYALWRASTGLPVGLH